jgi:hypothetical protein
MSTGGLTRTVYEGLPGKRSDETERVARVASGVASTPEPARKDKGEETERAQEA